MIIFKYATMLPYAVHLNYEQVHNIFASYADRADQATKDDRSVWALHWSGNTLTIAFKRKSDLNKFAKVFRGSTTTGSVPGGTRDRGPESPARTGKWLRRDFTSYYTLDFDPLDPERIGQLGAEMSDLADHVTGDDRAAYEVWFHDDKVHVGFRHEEDRDGFANIIDENAAAHEGEFTDAPPPADNSLHRVMVH